MGMPLPSGEAGRQTHTKMFLKGFIQPGLETGSQHQRLSRPQPSVSPPRPRASAMTVITAKATTGKRFNKRELSANDGIAVGGRCAEWGFLGRKTLPLCL